MADVTGSIQGADGEKGIVLNNAATEATLRLLLQSSLASNKQNLDQLRKLAKDGGIFDGAAMANVNDGMGRLNPTVRSSTSVLMAFEQGLYKTKAALAPFDSALGKLTDGTAKTSDLIGSFSQLPFGIGTVASAFARLARFQEDNLASYQKLTNAGIGFAGSLTDIRQASADMYLTMEQLTNLMTSNSQELTLLGGSANEGAMAFRRISKELIQSSAGKELQNLGYTTEQVNQGLIDYIAINGGRTKKDLENSGQLRSSAAAYMLELDRLADITGKTREQQSKDLKETMRKADMEMFRATLSEKDRQSFDDAMARGKALYGKAGEDIVIAAAQGRAVTGEAGIQLTALAPKAANAIGNFYNTIQRTGNKSAEIQNLENQSRVYNSEELKKFAGTVGTVGNLYEKIGDAALLGAKDSMTGQNTLKGIQDAEITREKERATRQNSEAATAVTQQNKINEARNEFLKAINELSQVMMPYLTKAVIAITDAIKWFTINFKGEMGNIALAAGGVVIGLGLLKVALGIVGGVASGIGSIGRAITGGPSSAPAVGGSRIPNSAARSGASGAIEGELAGASRGASGLLKGLGIAGTALMMGVSAKEYFDLEKKRKQGEITDENASREKAKVVGETGGGLTGALTLATAGSVFGPVGTIVGGIVGGIAGSKIGKDIAESLTTADKTKTDTKTSDAVKTDAALPQDIPSKDLLEGVNRLNTTMISLLKYMKDTASNTERTYKDVGNLKGKVW
jgi:hypothetical protein